MIMFRNDYSEGAHPQIMHALVTTNWEQTEGYTCDPYCKEAAELILDACELKPSEADVFFVPGAPRPTSSV